MLRKASSVLGIGLLCLWGFGLGDPGANPWITWMDGLMALFSFMIAVLGPPFPNRSQRVKGPLSVAAGLLFMTVIGFVSPGARWLSWWNLGFGCAYLLLAAAGLPQRHPPFRSAIPDQAEKEKTKRSA
jgi:hypothetical protein